MRGVRARPLLRHDHLCHHRRLRWHLGEEGLGAFPLHDALPPLLIPPLSERHSRRVLSLSLWSLRCEKLFVTLTDTRVSGVLGVPPRPPPRAGPLRATFFSFFTIRATLPTTVSARCRDIWRARKQPRNEDDNKKQLVLSRNITRRKTNRMGSSDQSVRDNKVHLN